MATHLGSLLGGLWQRFRGWFGRRKEEPSEDVLPDEIESFEDNEPKRTLSGSLSGSASRPASQFEAEAEPAPKERDAGERPQAATQLPEKTAAKPPARQVAEEPVDEEETVPTETRDEKTNLDGGTAEGPQDNDSDWGGILNAIYKSSRASSRSRPDPVEERRARIHQRQATKTRMRRARLGLPIARPLRGRESEEAPDVEAEREPSDETAPGGSRPDDNELDEIALGGRSPRGPPAREAARGAVDQGQQSKPEGITNRQATEMLSVLRRIEEHTNETKTATDEVHAALLELNELIPTLGTMTN